MHDPPGEKMPIERILYHIIGIIIVNGCYHVIYRDQKPLSLK